MNRKVKECNKGFSLIEVICAIALLAIIAAPILQIIYSSMAMNKNSRKLMAANDASQMVMEYLTSNSYEELSSNLMGSSEITIGSLGYNHKPLDGADASSFTPVLVAGKLTNYVELEKCYIKSCNSIGTPYIRYNSTVSKNVFVIQNVVMGGYHFNVGIHFEPTDPETNKYFVYKVDVDAFLCDATDNTVLIDEEPIASFHGSVFNKL